MQLFHFTSYTKEARPYLQDSFQRIIFQTTDGVVALRELSKIGFIVAAILSPPSLDPSNLKYTALTGASWLVLSFASNKLEQIAKDYIDILKEDEDEVFSLNLR